METPKWKAYRIVSGFGGGVSGLVFAATRSQAVEVFCRLHALYPAQIAILYCHPLQYN